MSEPDKPIRAVKDTIGRATPLPQCDDFVALAEILKPQGIRGEVKVRLLCDGADYFAHCAESGLLLMEGTLPGAPSQRGYYSAKLELIRSQGEFAFVRIAGFNSRNDVEGLRGNRVGMHQSDLPCPEKGSFYHFQLEGLAVIESSSGERLGSVERVLENPAHDQLVIIPDTPGAKPFLIPMVESMVRQIDVQSGRIEVDLPKGLIESQY